MAVERGQRIQEDTSAAKRNLYCDVRARPAPLSPFLPPLRHVSDGCLLLQAALLTCNLGNARVHVMQTCHKQYKNAMEMETHLSSYDHHHTKVLRVGATFTCTTPLPPSLHCNLRSAAANCRENLSAVAAAARNAAGDSGPHPRRKGAQGAAAAGEGVGATQRAVRTLPCCMSRASVALQPQHGTSAICPAQHDWHKLSCWSSSSVLAQVSKGSGCQHCHTVSYGDAAHAAIGCPTTAAAA